MIEDGGPAFPVPSDWTWEGISLRDYIAARAMEALIAEYPTNQVTTIVSSAYEFADAMLAKRIERHP